MSARGTHPQSLAHGDLGTALRLAIDAHTDPAAAQALHDLLRRLGPSVHGSDAGIYYGAPALAFVLHTAPGYDGALARLDDIVETITRSRLQTAHARIAAGELATFAEYDLFRGLTGLALLWLHRGTRPALLEDLLRYFVRLTQPAGGHPGWRVWHRRDAFTTPGPHTNNGLAHGICGPLSVLALARIQGATVDGHDDAIRRVLAHLDAAEHSNATSIWWDRWDAEDRPAPPPLSWCYGTPGSARAQQLAGLALNDSTRRRKVETALLQQLSTSNPQAQEDPTVCHGTAGVLRASERIAQDAHNPAAFRAPIDQLRLRLTSGPAPAGQGLIDGQAGVHLAAHGNPQSWDACLALT